MKPAGPFPIEKQRALGEKLMHTLGFDFEHGRLDISLHPFCGGVPDDVRITTRYYPDDFAHSLMAVIHETGYALYERGLATAVLGRRAGALSRLERGGVHVLDVAPDMLTAEIVRRFRALRAGGVL